MKVFVTGATGFIGSQVTQALLAGGHQVVGMARSDEGMAAVAAAGAAPYRAELTETDKLAEAARAADGVIHTAFIHDFSKYVENGEIDRRATSAMLEALAGSGKPFVNSSGTAMAAAPGRVGTENDPAMSEGPASIRGLSEIAGLAAAERGVRSSVVRLSPSTHDKPAQGLVSMLAATAREKGVSAYVGDGENRWPAVHRSDAVRLYVLALEKAEPGTRCHAVGEEGVKLRDIAEAIGAALGVPAKSITPEDAFAHFGFLGGFVGGDLPVSSAITRERLGWTPTGPTLLSGIRERGYLAG